jgi:hypothetical protein
MQVKLGLSFSKLFGFHILQVKLLLESSIIFTIPLKNNANVVKQTAKIQNPPSSDTIFFTTIPYFIFTLFNIFKKIYNINKK